MKTLIKQITKFGVVGVIAFVIDYGIMIFLTEVFHVHYLISCVVSYIMSLIFNYVCSMKFVFKSRDDLSKKKEFLIFVILCICGLLINQMIMWIVVEKFNIVYTVAKVMATVIVMVWNFVTRKKFLENN